MLRRRAPSALERLLGHRFRDRDLLAAALTHRSFAHERGEEEHYERLEFLGDAVLGLLAAERLYREHPDEPEGELSKRKAFLVSRAVLTGRARELGLGEALRLGVGEERSGGREKTSLLADAMEALIGAAYLDGGIAAARKVVGPLLAGGSARPAHGARDPKTRLQEIAQGRGWELPVYRLLDASGPDHAKRFRVECRLRGEPAGVGEGRTKKAAEQAAAAAALEGLEGPEQTGG